MNNIAQEAAEIGRLQAQVKLMSMTYQWSLKEEIAADLGLTFAQVDLPYRDWAAIRDPWLKAHRRVS